jgi:hypothetical protein
MLLIVAPAIRKTFLKAYTRSSERLPDNEQEQDA